VNGSPADTRSDVDILLFPVKLGRRRAVVQIAAAIGGVAIAGCGYHSAVEAPAGSRLSVAAAPFRTPHVGALQEALNGAREELSRAETLAAGGFPRLVVELVRVDELPAGIAALPGGGPFGRGANVGVVVRGWVEEREGAAPSRETGDIRRVETVAQTAEVVPSALAAADAVRAAARQAGRAVAARAIGFPEPSIEPM
jgi:hypothetical protein